MRCQLWASEIRSLFCLTLVESICLSLQTLWLFGRFGLEQADNDHCYRSILSLLSVLYLPLPHLFIAKYVFVKCYNIYCSLQKAREVIISEIQIICRLFWKLLWKCMTPFVLPCMLRHQCRQRKRDIAARVTAVITTGMKPWQPCFGPNNHYCLLLRPPTLTFTPF